MEIKVKDIVILISFIVIVSFVAITVKDNITRKQVIASTSMNSSYNPEVDTAVKVNSNVDNVVNSNEQTSNTNNTQVSQKQTEDVIVIKNGCIGVIDIPSIGIRAQIKSGTDDETLKNYVGKFVDSPNFGETGNTGLAAHNNVYTEIFRDLNKVKVGNNVRIITKQYEYIYRVTYKTVVDPTDLSVLESTDKKELTLITCTATAKSRVVVKCELILQNTL